MMTAKLSWQIQSWFLQTFCTNWMRDKANSSWSENPRLEYFQNVIIHLTSFGMDLFSVGCSAWTKHKAKQRLYHWAKFIWSSISSEYVFSSCDTENHVDIEITLLMYPHVDKVADLHRILSIKTSIFPFCVMSRIFQDHFQLSQPPYVGDISMFTFAWEDKQIRALYLKNFLLSNSSYRRWYLHRTNLEIKSR